MKGNCDVCLEEHFLLEVNVPVFEGVVSFEPHHMCEDCCNQIVFTEKGKKGSNFFSNLFQGKIGESFLETLLNKNLYSTFPYGYENTIRNLGCHFSNSDDDSAKMLRFSPSVRATHNYLRDLQPDLVHLNSSTLACHSLGHFFLAYTAY